MSSFLILFPIIIYFYTHNITTRPMLRPIFNFEGATGMYSISSSSTVNKYKALKSYL